MSRCYFSFGKISKQVKECPLSVLLLFLLADLSPSAYHLHFVRSLCALVLFNSCIWLPALLANSVAFFQSLSFIMSLTFLSLWFLRTLEILIHSFLRAAFVSATLPGIGDSMGKDTRSLFLWPLPLINIFFFQLLSSRCSLILNIQTLISQPSIVFLISLLC